MQIVDFRKLGLKSLFGPRFSHLLLLLYWPLHGLAFGIIEALDFSYTPIYHPLDDAIPFCEAFAIPYYFWFAYIALTVVYTAICDVSSYKKYMWFIIITYSATLIIYLIFPNMQELRPDSFERDNILTRIIANTYRVDTNTNVFPSLHVIGAIATLIALWHSKHFSTRAWRIANLICTILICLSTVFIKQHSVLDIVGGVIMCLVVYPFLYKTKPKDIPYPYYYTPKKAEKSQREPVILNK